MTSSYTKSAQIVNHVGGNLVNDSFSHCFIISTTDALTFQEHSINESMNKWFNSLFTIYHSPFTNYDYPMRLLDISVPISAATPTYPGDPGIEITQWAAMAKGDAANVSLLHFGAHTATHIDAPAHFIEGAPGADTVALDVLIGPSRVVRIADEVGAIDAGHLAALNLDGVMRILFKTRNSGFWRDSVGFRKDFTYLTPDAARALVEAGVRLVGVDYLSVEQFQSEHHETHKILLSNGVVIVEGLNLSEISAGEYELICLPLRIAGGLRDGAPARAVLRTFD
ncbi:MAG: arylformamidase [Acidobacteriota bacterium]|jgi:arylformamidase|nr:arylformamidase [Acidobacteriota bacterium]